MALVRFHDLMKSMTSLPQTPEGRRRQWPNGFAPRHTSIILLAAVLLMVAVTAVVVLWPRSGANAPAADIANMESPALTPLAPEPATAPPSSPSSTIPPWLAKQRLARTTTPTAPEAQTGEDAAAGSSTAAASPPATVTATNVVRTGGQTPLSGVWSGNASMLARYLLSENPSPSFTVPVATLAELYVRYASEAGLRADVLWAQMLHETGFGRYRGDVEPAQNNYAGIGATGGGEPGCSFATAEAGVMAHVAHMVAYVYVESPVAWANSQTDPRFAAVTNRGSARVLADLDGRWAVPGIGYGARIEEHVAAINRTTP